MRQPFHKDYFAMYSSVYGGTVTDPALMLVPVDDHMVHRGDGIFETLKCLNGSIYNMKGHLERLEYSARLLHFELPTALDDISSIVLETVRVGKQADCLVRILVSRGPGSLDVNPYSCPKSQLYVITSRLKEPFMEKHPDGARLGVSSVVAKRPFFAGVKSCNYLPNVLMKKEAVDIGVDFVAAFDERGFLAEGATENVGIVTKQKKLLFPKTGGILRGTTMIRVMELAKQLVESGELTEVAFADISKEDVLNATEVLIAGTTPNVTTVKEYDGKMMKDGGMGPVFQKLSAFFLDDLLHNNDLHTPVFVS
ncbi:aminotransferase class IV [Verrucomicrobiota bacterium]